MSKKNDPSGGATSGTSHASLGWSPCSSVGRSTNSYGDVELISQTRFDSWETPVYTFGASIMEGSAFHRVRRECVRRVNPPTEDRIRPQQSILIIVAILARLLLFCNHAFLYFCPLKPCTRVLCTPCTITFMLCKSTTLEFVLLGFLTGSQFAQHDYAQGMRHMMLRFLYLSGSHHIHILTTGSHESAPPSEKCLRWLAFKVPEYNTIGALFRGEGSICPFREHSLPVGA